MIRRNLLLLVAFAFAFNLSNAQQKMLTLKHLTSENGLSDNQVTCALRDKLGFMWIGTKDGLNRYDGKEFYVFKNNPAATNSICGNSIKCLELDNDSILWIGTAGSGFSSYDFRTGKFKTYNKDNSPLVSDAVNDIAFDKHKNCLWLALNNFGLQVFDLANLSLAKNLISANTYYDVMLMDTVPYFAGITESLKRLEKIGKFRTPITEYAKTINSILYGSDGHIWCGAWDNGLHEFDQETNRLNTYYLDGTTQLNFSGNEIITLAEDENKLLWCGTKSSGILFFDLKTKSFHQEYYLPGIESKRINCLFIDDFKRIWIGTESGLFIYDPINNQFQITRLPVPPNSERCKVHDRLVLQSGLELLVSECGLFYKTKNEQAYHHKDLIYRNEKQQLFSIFMDYKNRIYVGTNKTILFLDTLNFALQNMPCSKVVSNHWFHSTVSSRVNSIAQYIHKSDTLLVASFYGQGIFMIQPEKKNIFRMFAISKDITGYFDNLTRKIFFDSKSNFWICGASSGISQVLLPDSGLFSNFISLEPTIPVVGFSFRTWGNKKLVQSPTVNDVFDIAESNDGSYWLTTQGQGLIKFSPNDDSIPFTSYANDVKSLQGLAKSGTDNLWMISSTGLFNYNSKTNRYKLYDSKNGVSENISGYFFKTQSQNLFVGFDGGYISFNPKNIIEDKEKPSASITRLWIMDLESDSILNSGIRLTYDKNFLKFYVSANCFSNNEQITYSYFLEGIDNNWRNNENNPLITYTNLPHGNFTLKIKAINSDGVESDIMSMPVIITPPFYRTSWFYLLVLLLVISGVYFFYKYRIRQILKLQEVRNKIARDLHDDIGSTLGSINLFSQVAGVKLTQESIHEVKPILEKIGASSREIIDKTGDAVWAVNPANDTVENLFLRMEAYAAELLGTAGIIFTINCDSSLRTFALDMTQRKNIFLIYKEAIHNIIKYAAASKVDITLARLSGKIQLLVKDNGKGFISNESKTYNGNGLKNMKARSIEINGDLKIHTTHNGVSIELRF